MAIATAVQRGNSVYIYGDNRQLLTTINGLLHGYTGSNVSIKRGNWIYVYDEHGRLETTYSC